MNLLGLGMQIDYVTYKVDSETKPDPAIWTMMLHCNHNNVLNCDGLIHD